MILNNKIIEDIKRESHLLFDKAGDFALLGSLIFEKTERTIGVNTLKRLFCYINDDRKSSDYTLNTIALYLGYSSWDEYASAINKVNGGMMMRVCIYRRLIQVLALLFNI